MIQNRIFLALLLALPLAGQSLGRLPAWARPEAEAASRETPPEGANAWVLLFRTELSYAGGGEIRSRTFRLVKILAEKGIQEGTFRTRLQGGGASAITALKGWNLRPDGDVETLSRSDLKIANPDPDGALTRTFVASTQLPRLAKGSLVAFESEERENFLSGPAYLASPVEDIPVRRWEIARGEGGFFSRDRKGVPMRVEVRRWATWGLTPEPIPGGIAARQIHPFPADEEGLPAWDNYLPRVEIAFLDPNPTNGPDLRSWDGIARWSEALFRPGLHPSGQLSVKDLSPSDGLRAIHAWMAKELRYKQLYFSPDRGWAPMACPDVVRRRDGDCKDSTSCFLGEASAIGFTGYPALCRILEGEIEADQPVGLCFNHVIAALSLERSLGLPAEFETPEGRFLLVDTTDRFCPFGYLPSDHRNRRVLICTPRGGIWVTVPEKAVLRPELSVNLQGKVAEGGSLAAEIRIQEQGDALQLRAWTLQKGREGLRERLAATLFRFPSTGELEVKAASDPLDLDHPFSAEVKVHIPDGLVARGSFLTLVPWGLPDPVPSIQRAGHPRQGPVHHRDRLVWDLIADWDFPSALQPVLASVSETTPFRSLIWSARSQDRRAHVAFHEETQDSDFPMERKDEGLALWKKDHNLVDRIRSEGCTFRRVPSPAREGPDPEFQENRAKSLQF